ncbi:MAG TPA: urease accessory protein UreD [Nitrososphaeraceae archaeon]|jgi:urease accessory protein|nr:urease accessory protein UreD [Nitrososphaeraceae archaeon]
MKSNGISDNGGGGGDDTSSMDFYIPRDTPPEVLAYGSELQQLGVGRAGKLGALTLKLEYDSDRGKTIVRDLYTKVPLYAQRALYLEESLPQMAYMYIISPSGGILQGDRYRMDISLSKGALAHITTQGATRIYRMERNYATQIVNIDLGPDSYFELIPDQIIPYRNSRFYQTIKMRVHDSSTMIYSEMIVPGRVASGESFEYDICYMKTVGLNQANQLRFTDIAILEPKERKLSQLGVLGNYTVVGNVYLLCPIAHVKSIKDEVNSALSQDKEVLGGASVLPYSSGLIVRLLGDGASQLRNAIFEVVRITRRTILNAEFSGIRKG